MILCEGLPIIGFFFFISMPVLLVKYLIQDFRKRYRHQRLEQERLERFEKLEQENRERIEFLRKFEESKAESRKTLESAYKTLDECKRLIEDRESNMQH